MAKSTKSKAATVTNSGSKAAAAEEVAVPLAEQEAPKKMSKEEAQSILDQYSGINGTEVPAIVKKAKETLKAKSE